jgi:tRNA(adenine34) deaminase
MSKIEFTDQYFMQLAYKEAQQAFHEDEIPVGAVIVANKQIIAKTHNLTQKLKDVTAHAEMLAITAATEYLGGKYLNDCTLYVTLEPCPMCAGALAWAQIGRIVYGAPDEKRGCMRHTPSLFHPRTEISQGLMEQEATLLIKEFFAKKRD